MRTRLVALVTLCLLLCACGAAPTATIIPTSFTPAATPTPIIELLPTATPELPTEAPPTEAPTVPPTEPPPENLAYQYFDVSPVTGRPGRVCYNPVVVMIEETAAARPQVNLSQADVIYEAYVEGGYTRMLAVFNDNAPERVGYVRSMREVFVKMALEWDPVVVHHGRSRGAANVDVGAMLNAANLRGRVDGETQANSAAIWRDPSRPATHDVLASVVQARAKATRAPSRVRSFKFTSQKPTGAAGTEVSFKMSSKSYKYVYNAATNTYTRYLGGAEFKDNTGTTITPANVILQTVNHRVVDSEKHVVYDAVGSGTAKVYTGGVCITATWRKDSLTARTIYYDQSGNEIALQVGTTMIHLL